MAMLKNQRHELFAQALAQGKSAAEAYVEAGYKDNRHNAASLAREEHISTRVLELQGRAAKRAEFTIHNMAQQLDDDRDFARKLNHSAAAVTASMGKAKVLGLSIDRMEIRTGDMDGLNAEDRDQLREVLRRELENHSGQPRPAGPGETARKVPALH